jgi:hypothetical protein
MVAGRVSGRLDLGERIMITPVPETGVSGTG